VKREPAARVIDELRRRPFSSCGMHPGGLPTALGQIQQHACLRFSPGRMDVNGDQFAGFKQRVTHPHAGRAESWDERVAFEQEDARRGKPNLTRALSNIWYGVRSQSAFALWRAHHDSRAMSSRDNLAQVLRRCFSGEEWSFLKRQGRRRVAVTGQGSVRPS
jgi:hypothetical protein